MNLTSRCLNSGLDAEAKGPIYYLEYLKTLLVKY